MRAPSKSLLLRPALVSTSSQALNATRKCPQQDNEKCREFRLRNFGKLFSWSKVATRSGARTNPCEAKLVAGVWFLTFILGHSCIYHMCRKCCFNSDSTLKERFSLILLCRSVKPTSKQHWFHVDTTLLWCKKSYVHRSPLKYIKLFLCRVILDSTNSNRKCERWKGTS